MAWLHRLRRFVRTLTGHLVIGGMLIHALLIPLLFFGITVIVKESTQVRFIDQIRSDSWLFSRLVSRDLSRERVQALLDDALLDGRVVYAEIEMDDSVVTGKGSLPSTGKPFQEDFAFNQHGDSVYYVAIALEPNHGKNKAVLKLGYDETPTNEQIAKTFEHGLYLALAYVLMSLVFGTYMGAKLTRPLRDLRDSARGVASGDTEKQLAVNTTVSEIFTPTTDRHGQHEA